MSSGLSIFDAPDVMWCNNVFDCLVEGGVWGCPRSGLTFTKEGSEFILTDKFAWAEDCPMSEDEWVKWQAEDYEKIKFYFTLAGIPVSSRVDG